MQTITSLARGALNPRQVLSNFSSPLSRTTAQPRRRGNLFLFSTEDAASQTRDRAAPAARSRPRPSVPSSTLEGGLGLPDGDDLIRGWFSPHFSGRLSLSDIIMLAQAQLFRKKLVCLLPLNVLINIQKRLKWKTSRVSEAGS